MNTQIKIYLFLKKNLKEARCDDSQGISTLWEVEFRGYSKFKVGLGYMRRLWFPHCQTKEFQKKIPIMREMCLRCLLKWSRWLHAYECFAWMNVCVPPGTHGGQKRRSEEGPRIKKKLWAVMWVPRIKPGSSTRTTGALNHWAICPASVFWFFKRQKWHLGFGTLNEMMQLKDLPQNPTQKRLSAGDFVAVSTAVPL